MKKHPAQPPRSMDMNVMRQIFGERIHGNPKICLTNDYAISTGIDFIGRILAVGDSGPYRLEDYRMGLLLRGEIHATVNLIPVHLTAGQLTFLGQGSIVQFHHASSDAMLKGCIVSADLVHQIAQHAPLPLLSQAGTFFSQTATASDCLLIEHILQTAFHLIQQADYPAAVLHDLFAALIHFYNHLFVAHHAPAEGQGHSDLFSRFISLVNAHCDEARTIAYYADRLCLSPRYFSSLIQKQSGHSAKHWIDKAVVTRAKILLRHSPKTISQISAELHFPNDSFFCKFFRRLTGMSPTAYREQG